MEPVASGASVKITEEMETSGHSHCLNLFSPDDFQKASFWELAPSGELKEKLTDMEALDMSPNDQNSISCLRFKLRTMLRNGPTSVLFIKMNLSH